MAQKTEQSAITSDSFEALLRRAARSSHVSLRSTLPSGTKLAGGRFEITRRIGEGGMGVVYEAFDAERRGKVALKTLSRLDAPGIYRLKNEFRALADVSHPNLVRLHELFADEALWFFTMDLVDGQRFDTWVRPDGALDDARLRAALPELLRAILAIHEAGKLHRDLKPSNVLVTDEGRVVVLDFGLAVDPELGGVGQTIADESVSGTPAYMAPEQAAGQAATRASDVYAFGVMLFEALTGKLPFEGRVGQMLAAKQRDEAPDVRVVCSDAPSDLAVLCAELLQREPRARPNGEQLRERLKLAGELYASDSMRASAAPQITGLVGRNDELAALRDAYAASCDGDKPVIVLLSGESGIGKSALVERFLSELREQSRAVVLAGRCYERESVPFKGFDVLVDELSRYLRKLSAVETAALIPRDVSALRRLFPVLGRIDAIARAPERTVGDPLELRRRGFLALGELFGRVRDRQPLVIAIDDLQWSDHDSTTLLLHLVRQADAPRVLLIASHRSEGMRENPVLTPLYETLEVDIRLDLRKIGVGPLSIEAATSLVSEIGGTAQALVREAGGNPFLLSELARAGGATQGRSLSQILRARVAELPRAERVLLEVMAVVARPLPLSLAGAAAQIPEQARTAFDRLRAEQLARSAVERGSVECYHDRVREAVASGLGAEVARAHHAALAHALLGTSDPDPEHLSEHFEHAGNAALAARYAMQAGDRAMQGFAFNQSARLYDKALSLGAFEASEEQRLLVALGDALALGGRGAVAAEAYLRAAKRIPERAADELKSKAAQQFLMSGRLARGRALLDEALLRSGMRLSASPARAAAVLALERTRLRLRGMTLAARNPEPQRHTQLAALSGVVQGLMALDLLNTAGLNLRLLRLALDAGNVEIAIGALLTDIWHRSHNVGDPDHVPELVRRVQALKEKLPEPGPAVVDAWQDQFLGNYEIIGRPNGDVEAALQHFDRFLAFAQGNPGLVPTNLRAAGQHARNVALFHLGRLAALAREVPALLDDAWQRNDLSLAPHIVAIASHAWLAAGAQAQAEREFARAFRDWSALGNPLSLQDHALHSGWLGVLHYRGDTRAAWDASLAHEARFAGQSASHDDYVLMTHSHRILTAAALAAETANASERDALIREAERMPARWGSLGARWRTFVLLSRAAVACAWRDRDRAVQLLRKCDALPHAGVRRGPIKVQAVRWRLGMLIGGDEGKALVSEADAFFRAGGAIDPERLVASLMPGLEIR